MVEKGQEKPDPAKLDMQVSWRELQRAYRKLRDIFGAEGVMEIVKMIETGCKKDDELYEQVLKLEKKRQVK